MEPQRWPALARFGFVMSAAGLVLWMAGGVMSTFAVWPRGLEALWGRVAFDLLARPQVGWGLFAVGLIPIGLAAVIRQLSPPPRMLLPIGGLFLLGPLVKYLLGEQIGGSTIFVAFGCGWLLVAVQLLRSSQASAAEVPSR